MGDYVTASKLKNSDGSCTAVYSVTNSQGFVPSTDYFSKEVFSKELKTYRIVERNMVAYNPSRINVGSIALQDKVDSVIVSPLYVVFSVDESRVLPSYIVRFLKSQPGKDQIASRSTGSVRNNLKFDALCKMELAVPPIGEQRKQLSHLETVERQIIVREKYCDELNKLVKSRFIETFLDGKWPIKELHELADIQGGLTKNKKRAQYDLQLPYLRVANVLQGKLDLSEMLEVGLTEQERGKTLLANGDLLFVEGNGSKDQIGRCAIWDSSIDPCVHQNHLIRARFNSEMLPVYALAFFRSPEGRKQIVQRAVSTSGLFTLSTRKIKSLEIPVAPIELQHEFAAFVQQVDKLEFVPNRGRAYPSGFSEVSSHSSSYFPEVARKPSSTSLPMTSGSVLMDGLSALPHKRDLNTGSPQLWVEDIFSSSIDSRRYLFGVLRPSVSFHVESTEYH